MSKSHVSNSDYQVLANTVEIVSQTGIFTIANSGDQGSINLSALGVIQLQTPLVSIGLADFINGGSFNVLTGGIAPVVQLSSASTVANSNISLANSGVGISYMMADSGPASVLNFGSAILSAVVSEGALFSKLTMLPDEVLIEVGSTILSISDEGFTVTSGDTVFSVTPEGINEASGDVTRELNSEGHNFTSAETELNVSAGGTELETPSLTLEVEGTSEENASMKNSTYDATGEIESAITTIE
jgi:hypothetical protein